MNAGRYQFRYIAQRLLDDRAEKAERAAAAQPYLDTGQGALAGMATTHRSSYGMQSAPIGYIAGFRASAVPPTRTTSRCR